MLRMPMFVLGTELLLCVAFNIILPASVCARCNTLEVHECFVLWPPFN